MSRSLPSRLIAALVLVLTLAAGSSMASESTSEQVAMAARIATLKRIQQQILMREALEATHERGQDAAGTRESALNRSRRLVEEGAAPVRGITQRPAPAETAELLPAWGRGRSAGPLTANSALSYATNVEVNDPNLDTPSRADGQSEPSIAAWGNYVIAGWNDGRGNIGDIGTPPPTLVNSLNYAYSTDGGATFITAPSTGPTALPIQLLGGVWTSDPVIAVNEKTGDFYFCGLFDPPNGSGADEHGVAVARANFNAATNAITWTRPVVIKSLLQVDGFIDKPWIAVDSLSGNVYVTYTRFTPTQDSIVVSRSTNRGATWGPQITLSSPASAGLVQGSRPGVGPAGEIYVTWKEIALSGTGQDFIRVRRSNDFGVSWLPEQTAAAFFDNFGTGAPGFNREQGIALPSIAVDRSSGANRGRVYVAWNESVNFYDSIPDTNAAPVLNEAEPNDSVFNAQPFTPGTAIRGRFNTLSDFDYYKFSATQGTSYIFWANELPTRYTMRIFGTDGVTRLAFSGDRNNSPPNPGFIVWTCPRSGSYFMRMAIFGSTLGDYRIDTGIDAPGGTNQRARDQRDVFVASSPNGNTWSTPAMLSAPEPGLFDNWLPEVAVTAAGDAYALWYDFSDSPIASSGGQSQAYMSRSADGGATWASLGPVSDRFVNWSAVNSNIIPNQGDYTALFANADRVFPCWTDGRVGTPDIWAAVLPVGAVRVEIEATIADTNRVTLTWRASGPYPASAQVVRVLGVGDYTDVIGTVVFDVNGRATFQDPNVLTSAQYRYALQLLIGASQKIMGERTVITPGRERPPFTFLGATPNPANKDLHVRFSLPDNIKADLRLFDITGRPLRWQEYQGAGPYEVDFGTGLDLKPGLYFLKLSHAGVDKILRISLVP